MAAPSKDPGRALHHKGLGGFEASLEVLGELPEPARHGLFAHPGKYDALVRYSNGASAVPKDDAGDVRGIAVKVFRNADEFVAMVWGARSPALALPRIVGALGLRGLGLLRRLLGGIGQPVASLANRRFFSALPIPCGPYAVRFALTPVSAPDAAPSSGADRLGNDLAARLRIGPIEYALELQFFVDETRRGSGAGREGLRRAGLGGLLVSPPCRAEPWRTSASRSRFSPPEGCSPARARARARRPPPSTARRPSSPRFLRASA